MKIQLDDNALQAVNKVVDVLGLFSFSAVTGGIVALALDVSWNLDPRINVIAGALVALTPAVIEWAKRSLLEMDASRRKWEEIRLNAELREKAELERAKTRFRLEEIKEQNEHERSLWSARNEYMRLSVERQKEVNQDRK